MKDRVPFEQFYEATGRANAAWQRVEDGICDIFSRTVICSVAGTMKTFHPNALRLIYGIFYASTNIRGRLGMVDTLIKELIGDEEIMREWTTISNKTLRFYKRRNVIAHGYVLGNETGASVVHISIHNGSLKDKYLDIEQVRLCEQSFRRLGDRSHALAQRINEYFTALGKGRD